jgi:hypothetical protein
MVDFLKKLKALVVPPVAGEPPKKSGRGDKETTDAAREQARRDKEAADRAREAARVEKEKARREKEAARRAQEAAKPKKETGEGANAGIVAPRSSGSAPMQAGSAATPAVAIKRQPADINRIDLTDAWEIQYRRKQFGCTELQLRQAVAAVGDAADKVKLQLRKRSVPPKGGKQRYE